jgi:type IV pilus assembly protein PilV
MKSLPAAARRQQGAFLLEALIAILIFSLGVLGIVGLQARSLKAVGDAQYRGEAAFYAQTLAGRMWAHDPTSLQTYFGTSGTGFTNWSDQVTAAGSGLPGAADRPPEISFTNLSSKQGVMATIKIYWQAPGEADPCGGDTSDVKCWHQYVTSAVVGNNVGS